MEKVLLKKQLRIYLGIFFLSFFLGVVFDHFLLYRFFSVKREEEIEESETKKTEPVVLGSTDTDTKIMVENTCKVHVDTSGAVKQPGVFCLEEGAMVIDAITKAGGFTNTAAYRFISRKINLSQLLVDNQKIYIPFEDEMDCKLYSFLPQTKEVQTMISNSSPVTYPTSEIEDTSSDTEENVDECVNINTGSLEDLDSLSGIGETTAKKIIEGRPYEKIEDLLNVSGIGESLYAKIKDSICI